MGIILKNIQKFSKKYLTSLDKRAIIVNCIIIAYYALLRVYVFLSKPFLKKCFDNYYIYEKRGAIGGKIRRLDRTRRIYYFEWSD